MDAIEFGKRLCYYRRKSGLNRSKLALLLGYKSPSTISKMEKGQISPSFALLKKMTRVLDVEISDLMGDMGQVDPARSKELFLRAGDTCFSLSVGAMLVLEGKVLVVTDLMDRYLPSFPLFAGKKATDTLMANMKEMLGIGITIEGLIGYFETFTAGEDGTHQEGLLLYSVSFDYAQGYLRPELAKSGDFDFLECELLPQVKLQPEGASELVLAKWRKEKEEKTDSSKRQIKENWLRMSEEKRRL